jgi:hypothetical protein
MRITGELACRLVRLVADDCVRRWRSSKGPLVVNIQTLQSVPFAVSMVALI